MPNDKNLENVNNNKINIIIIILLGIRSLPKKIIIIISNV